MGPLTQMLDMIPGMGRMTEQLAPDVTDKQFKRIEAIISSMTLQRAPRPEANQRQPQAAHRPRFRALTVQEVNDLLNQFRQMQKMMKQFGAGGHGMRGNLMDMFQIVDNPRSLRRGLQAFGTLCVPYHQRSTVNGTYSSAPAGREEAAVLSRRRGGPALAARWPDHREHRVLQPLTDPETVSIDTERARYWLSVGAQPSESVARLLKAAGVEAAPAAAGQAA